MPGTVLRVKQGPKRDSNAPRQRGQQPHCGVKAGGTVVPWRGSPGGGGEKKETDGLAATSWKTVLST